MLTVSTCFDRVRKNCVQEKCWDQWMERSTSWSSPGSLWPWAVNVIERTTAQAVLQRTKRVQRSGSWNILSRWECLVWSTSFLLKNDWAWLSNNQLLIFYKNVLHEVATKQTKPIKNTRAPLTLLRPHDMVNPDCYSTLRTSFAWPDCQTHNVNLDTPKRALLIKD